MKKPDSLRAVFVLHNRFHEIIFCLARKKLLQNRHKYKLRKIILINVTTSIKRFNDEFYKMQSDLCLKR